MTMKKLILLITVVIIFALYLVLTYLPDSESSKSNSTATAAAEEYRAGSFIFSVSLNPATPRVGKNTLTIDLKDVQGNPVEKAVIAAVAEMPAMGSMPTMRAPADMEEVSPGRYRGTFEPSMDGSWPLTLHISQEELGSARVSFDLATGRKGIQLSSGATRTDSSQANNGGMMEEAPPGTVTLDARRRQLIGVKKALAEYRDMTQPIRAVGKIAYDETRMTDISLKFDAWIGELHADYIGKKVEKGEPLFTVYSPELLSAQQEYLELKKRSGAPSSLLSAARKRLRLWDMGAIEIAAIERQSEPFDFVIIRAPQSGVIVRKNIVEGTSHRAGMTLLRIADLSEVWVEADIYESDLSLVSNGMSAEVTLPHASGDPMAGTVSFIYPFFDKATRTGRVRLQLANASGLLKPDMYAEVRLNANVGRRLAVPEEAVIISGKKRFIFEDIGEGRLAPRRVTTGRRANGYIEIIEGISEGDCVVTSGNFLIASESRLKAGIEQW